VEDSRLLVLRKELDRTKKGLSRLYEAVELDLLPMDDTLRSHAHEIQAQHNETLLEIAELEDSHRQALPKVDSSKIQAFSKVLEARLKDVRNGFGKAYLRLLVVEIRLEGNDLKIRGSYAQLGDAFGLLEKMKLGEVPSLVRDWRARQESNPRPLVRSSPAVRKSLINCFTGGRPFHVSALFCTLMYSRVPKKSPRA
jgi:site-specific DNA recombinase